MDNSEIRVKIITQTPRASNGQVREQDYLIWIPAKELRDFVRGYACFLKIERNANWIKNGTTFINKNNVIYLNFDKNEYEMLLRINDLEEVLSKNNIEKELKDKINKENIEKILKITKEEYKEYKRNL